MLPSRRSCKGHRTRHNAQQFATVEVDSTFYGCPAASTVNNWAARTPEDFILCQNFRRRHLQRPLPAKREMAVTDPLTAYSLFRKTRNLRVEDLSRGRRAYILLGLIVSPSA